jgi:short-subunit dehydrogenase
MRGGVAVSRSIGVFGAGPGLGQAVAHRWAGEGYDVVLVGRRQEPLDALAQNLIAGGANAHVLTADLSDVATAPALAERVRAAVGGLDAIYYAPTPDGGFVPAVDLTPEQAQGFMPLAVYSLLAIVREFVPPMIEQGDGAILTAQGASAMRGVANLSGPGPAQAAQRNYLQSLHAELADKGVYVGMLYIGAIIEHSAFHTYVQQSGSGRQWGPTADPAQLADLLWNMHKAKRKAEAKYPA